jgi:predicted permease
MGWIRRLFRRRDFDQELDRELRFHIEELTQENISKGMASEEAHRQAMLAFGGRQQVKEELRDVYRLPVIETTAANLRFGLRGVRKAPAFSAAVILTLALGVGANSAVFSAINAILLRPLPFPHGDRLMLLRQYNRQSKSPQMFTAPVRLEDWNRMNSTFQAITGYYTEDVSEISGPLPEKVTRAYVAPRFLQVWGIAPALGRDFTPEEEKFGGPEGILISDRFWRRRFNGDPRAVGQTLRFGKNYSGTIIGVMPASFLFPDRNVDMWSPIPVDSPYAQSRESTWYTTIGRLKEGVSLEQARADLAVVQGRLASQFPATDAKLGVEIEPLKESTVAGSRRSLWALFAGVTLLLLIACTNIAGLLLARATHREHEIAVRFSLGASRRAIIAQLLAEVFVLACIGSLAGLCLSVAAAKGFQMMARDLPRVDEISLDWRIVAYSLACAVAATFLCGTFPAWRATREGIGVSLSRNARTQVSGRHPVQWLLAGVQVALAVTLLAGAGLLLRSFQELGRVSPGFDPSHVLTLHISASWGETADMKGLTQRINHTLNTLRALPGVEAAATSSTLPGVPNQFPAELKMVEGETDPNRKIIVEMRFVSNGYFATLHIPLLAGEACRESTNQTDIVVNRSFAGAYFGQNPVIGHHLLSNAFSGFPLTGEIRSIVGDAREQGINLEPMPVVYWCVSAPVPDPNYLIRTQGEPLAMAQTVRGAIHQVEPGRSVFDVMPLEERLSDAFAETRMRTVLLTLFALTAVALACVGLYGTISYLVTVRRREVGLRLALGAQRWQIAARFLLQGLRVCVVGCVCGLALAAASGRLLAGMLYGVTLSDRATMFGVVLMVLLLAGVAVLLPALRAACTDPMSVLREE